MPNIVSIVSDDRIRRQIEQFVGEIANAETRIASFKTAKEFEAVYFAPKAAVAAPQPAVADDGLLARIDKLREVGNWNVLVLLATEWTRREPGNPRAWMQLSEGYVELRQLPEALDAPEVAAREMVAETPDAVHGTLRLMQSPLHLRGTPPRRPVSPPRLGEHTDELLQRVLGATAEEIRALRDSGAVA